MTQAEVHVAPPHHSGANKTSAAARIGLGRPEAQITAIAVGMIAGAAICFLLTPDRDSAVEPTGWWAWVATAVMFGLAEWTVFSIQFRREGISFALSEIPLAFALVFLAPLPALLTRLPLAIPVLVFARKNRGYKLAFNVALFLFELSLAALLFRALLEVWGHDTAGVLTAIVVAWILVAPMTSILISVAISRLEGGLRERVIGELRATWWMYTVNAVLAAMTVALALVQPVLALLALLPAAGVWYVLHSYGELGQELRDLGAVHGFAGRIGRTLDVNEIADVAIDEVGRLLRSDAAALVRFTAGDPIVHRTAPIPVRLPRTPTAPGWSDLFVHGRARLVDAARISELGIEVDGSVPAMIVAPINEGSETFAAIVAVQDEAFSSRFDDADVARAQSIAEQLAVSLRRGMLHERLEWEARHDALTGLPARTLFERHVAEAADRRESGVTVVMMLDLDRFKEVNDTLGHHAGDDLLQQFSLRMSELLGPGDVLARLAGDEFAILCRRDDHDEVVEFARSCAREGGRPVVLDGLEIVVTVSVGVAKITAADCDALQPMRRADIAMYNAKWQRSGVEFYRDEIDRRTPARLSMLGDLRAAIESDALEVVYQPKLDVATGRAVGVEALVRWEHHSRGVVAPAEFVRVAEDTGLIKELTDLVLARGIETLRRFHDEDLDIGLSVNLSTHDLFDSRLPERVRAYLASHGVDPWWLTLEITESSLFVDAPRTRATIDDLHDVGLRMAVDDFGTGYSSLSYLRRLPVHELKIDQSFVGRMLTDPQDEVIVRSTVDLGHNLGLLVVAEGVESLGVLDRLREIGCDEAQGFVISQPLLADDLVQWLQRAEAARRADGPMAWVGSLP